MCGIFGIINNDKSTFNNNITKASLKKLALLSESRGKDSSGIAFRNNVNPNIEIVKGDIPIRELIKDNYYSTTQNKYFK